MNSGHCGSGPAPFLEAADTTRLGLPVDAWERSRAGRGAERARRKRMGLAHRTWGRESSQMSRARPASSRHRASEDPSPGTVPSRNASRRRSCAGAGAGSGPRARPISPGGGRGGRTARDRIAWVDPWEHPRGAATASQWRSLRGERGGATRAIVISGSGSSKAEAGAEAEAEKAAAAAA
jgi:hypothetical protein